MCGHGVSGISSAATPSASDVGSNVRSPSALDALGGVWKRLEPSSLCHVYTETPGPTSLFTPENTPLQLFSRFFTSEVWDLLVVETNRVAVRVCGNTPRAHPWTEVTVQEMKAFCGVLIFMGVCKQPRLDLYWSTKFPLSMELLML